MQTGAWIPWETYYKWTLDSGRFLPATGMTLME